VILGKDAYRQFQRDILGRSSEQIKPFAEILKPAGWAEEDVLFPRLNARTIHLIYTYHPTVEYKSCTSLAAALPSIPK
jgi:hypothetical protein